MWIKFANLCRKSDRMALAEKTLNSLMPGPEKGGDQVSSVLAFRGTNISSASSERIPGGSLLSP